MNYDSFFNSSYHAVPHSTVGSYVDSAPYRRELEDIP